MRAIQRASDLNAKILQFTNVDNSSTAAGIIVFLNLYGFQEMARPNSCLEVHYMCIANYQWTQCLTFFSTLISTTQTLISEIRVVDGIQHTVSIALFLTCCSKESSDLRSELRCIFSIAISLRIQVGETLLERLTSVAVCASSVSSSSKFGIFHSDRGAHIASHISVEDCI